MKILFVWSGLTGYMGDCWRALAVQDGVELKVSVDLGEKYFGGGFDADAVLRGLDWAAELPADWRPDIVFTVGWHNALCRSAALRKDWRDVPKVCCFDMPWRRSLRCLVARFVLGRYLHLFDAAYVSGASAAKYARWLGFRKVEQGLFSTDLSRFDAPHIGGQGFLFVGRNVRDKGLDVLREAHRLYQVRGGTWGLRIVNGVQPSELGDIYRAADCFVLPSRWEPWGVVLAEAAGAGLPIICTDRCGARLEVVRENGIVVPSEDAEALSRAMARLSQLPPEERASMGAWGRSLSQPFDCTAWAARTQSLAKSLVNHTQIP